jgi:Tol biopolymer transport system component
MEKQLPLTWASIVASFLAACGGGDSSSGTSASSMSSTASFTITANAGTGGGVNPISTTVANGSTAAFNISPQIGYKIASVNGCNGTLSGTTYTTGIITAACSVTISFTDQPGSGTFTTTLVSAASGNAQANGESNDPSISADGRYVAFESAASNLVSGDTNGFWDVFVHDRFTGTTSLISVTSGSASGNGASYAPAISADGRYVAFVSAASNLVLNDTNAATDVFVRDLSNGTTIRASIASDGAQAQSATESSMFGPLSLSTDGRVIAFASNASNLVENDTNSATDIFLHDRLTRTTTRVSVDSSGNQVGSYYDIGSWNPSMSGDGRYVTFESGGAGLGGNGGIGVYVRDRLSGTTTCVSKRPPASTYPCMGYHPSISADGRHVAFQSDAWDLVALDTNNSRDVFVYDQVTGLTTRESLRYDSLSKTSSQVNGESLAPSISGDGRYVAFVSSSAGVVPNDTNSSYDVFVRDRVAETTSRVSVNSSGTQANMASSDPSYSFHRPEISVNGRYVTFHSRATNLVAGDTNAITDAFVVEW